MIMEFSAGIVTRAQVTISAAELGRNPNGLKGLKGLVDGRQADSGKPGSHKLKQIFCRRMACCLAELIIFSQALRSTPQAGGLENVAYGTMVKLCGIHRSQTPFVLASLTPRLCTNFDEWAVTSHRSLGESPDSPK